MNGLSWMLYLAEVSSSMAGLLVAGGIAMVIAAVGAAMWASDEGKPRPSWVTAFLKIAPVMLLLAVFLPSSQTVYAIAASEYGEELAKTETAGKAVEALNAWLDRQIGDASAEPEPQS